MKAPHGLKTKRIAITGGFGSGKSAVLGLFRAEGANILDADKIAKKQLRNPEILKKLKKIFPQAFAGKNISRKKLASEIFVSKKKRRALEALIHPRVKEHILRECSRARTKLTAVEVPLLYEAGWEKLFDEVVVVSASRDVIQKRLAQKGFAKEEIEKRAKAQMALQEKRKKADWVIQNSGSKKELKKRFKTIYKKINA